MQVISTGTQVVPFLKFKNNSPQGLTQLGALQTLEPSLKDITNKQQLAEALDQLEPLLPVCQQLATAAAKMSHNLNQLRQLNEALPTYGNHPPSDVFESADTEFQALKKAQINLHQGIQAYFNPVVSGASAPAASAS